MDNTDAYDFSSLIDLENQPPSLVSLYTSPEMEVHVDQRELLKILGLDVENHHFYISKLEEERTHDDQPWHVIITVRIKSDCGVIKYGE